MKTCFGYIDESVKVLGSLLVALNLVIPSQSFAEDILIAVASNFAEPMEQLIAGFEDSTTHEVEMSIGSSGRFYAQIVNGAPFHIFFSADQEKIAELVQAGLTVTDTDFTYAVGRLALWSSDDTKPIVDLEELDGAMVERLAIANPRLAPYGTAAVEVLEALGLADKFQGKLVQGENIAQAFQYVDTGNVKLGFVALSQIYREGNITRGSGVQVPEHLHTPIRQDAVMLKRGEGCSACKEFLDYIKSDEVRTILQEFGYQ